MKRLSSIVGVIFFVSTLFAMPAMAQIADGVKLTTSFPFYAENAELPAGTYTIYQSQYDPSILRIESADRSHAAFIVDFVPSEKGAPHQNSDVTFRRYGDMEFLHRIWISGQQYGIVVEPTKAEKKMAEKQAPQEHSVNGQPR